MKKLPAKIDWFWAHRRNASLHHMSLLMTALRGKGWTPVVDFWFDNQAVVGVPGKGCFIFYDEKQLSSGGTYADVQRSIDRNPDFVKDFRRRTSELFGAIFFKCIAIDEANLPLLSHEDLSVLHREFVNAITVAPIITVQLWGIEACFDENYRIMRFLRQRLADLGKSGSFGFYREMLSVNAGETVALSEQKDFYRVTAALDRPEICRLFSANSAKASEGLKKFPLENSYFENHARKYEWVNTEYVSGGWTREKWIALFQGALINAVRPAEKLKELEISWLKLIRRKEKALKELDPPEDVRHAMAALSELIAQRDWSKGYYTKILLSYHKLLNEVARREGLTRDDLFSWTVFELGEYFAAGTCVGKKEIERRKKHGYIFVIRHGDFTLHTGKTAIDRMIATEGISEPFEKLSRVSSFKGLPASRGRIRGVVRVLEDASKINDVKDGEIIVTYMTTIEFTPIFRKAKGVITDEGGMSCHAAIISREFKIPCIVGTKVATRILRDGDRVEIDAESGIVSILSHSSN